MSDDCTAGSDTTAAELARLRDDLQARMVVVQLAGGAAALGSIAGVCTVLHSCAVGS